MATTNAPERPRATRSEPNLADSNYEAGGHVEPAALVKAAERADARLRTRLADQLPHLFSRFYQMARTDRPSQGGWAWACSSARS